ncbi:hypothetical protein [Zymomonas mobilis]|uniref:hypothetical protein n=1 Tax=Zymomonas mobilis TaxID=542 RepID=UPI000A4C86D7|nr:hypothetical protein [Zymomonas mobilis]UBQ08758.1 hypothetical protein LB319_09565 [Zymomonas mobilis]
MNNFPDHDVVVQQFMNYKYKGNLIIPSCLDRLSPTINDNAIGTCESKALRSIKPVILVFCRSASAIRSDSHRNNT